MARRKRWRRLVAFGCLGVAVGAIGGGIVLDERPPDSSDLDPPALAAEDSNPLAWAIERPPADREAIDACLAASDFPRTLWIAPRDGLGEHEFTRLARELRAPLAPWYQDFEHEFERVGGDPSVAVPPRERAWSTEPPASSECTEWLELGVRLDAASGDLAAALAKRHLVLRVESWRARAGGLAPSDLGASDGETTVDRFGPLLRSLDGLLELVEAGALAEVRDRRRFDDLKSWRLEGAITGLAGAHFRDRRARWSDPEVRRALLGTDEWGERVKAHRAERRLAEGIRRARARVRTHPPMVAPTEKIPENSSLARIWIDPHGDTILAPETIELGRWEERARSARARLRALRIAIAVEVHRRDGWSPSTLPFDRRFGEAVHDIESSRDESARDESARDESTSARIDGPGADLPPGSPDWVGRLAEDLGLEPGAAFHFERDPDGAIELVLPDVSPPIRVRLSPPTEEGSLTPR